MVRQAMWVGRGVSLPTYIQLYDELVQQERSLTLGQTDSYSTKTTTAKLMLIVTK